jgi:hypothetical protein
VDEFNVGEEEGLLMGGDRSVPKSLVELAPSAVVRLSVPSANGAGASGRVSDTGGVIEFGLAGMRVCGIDMELFARLVERRGRAMAAWGGGNRAVYFTVHSTVVVVAECCG